MKNNGKIIASMLLVLILAPGFAMAHGNKDKDSDKESRGSQIRAELVSRISAAFGKHDDDDDDGDDDRDEKRRRQTSKSGTVTTSATTTSSFVMTTKAGEVLTVTVNGETKITNAFNVSLALGSLAVNDSVAVKGTLTGTTIAATKIVVTPKNTHKAKARGTVTAVATSTLTLQGNHHGVVYSVQVNTANASTTVKGNGSATTTASIAVGDTIKVKGLWDELLNVLNAFKIFILKK